MEMNEKDVSRITDSIIFELLKKYDSSYTKAVLANLRKSMGRELGTSIEIWPLILEHVPDEYIEENPRLTAGERVIINTMQLFALYSQGVELENAYHKKHNRWENIGTSFSSLRNTSDCKEALDRRFNVMITSTTYDELLYHLRQMINLLKAKGKGQINIDFSGLSEDLSKFLIGNENEVRIAWAREYYRNKKSKDEKGNGKDE